MPAQGTRMTPNGTALTARPPSGSETRSHTLDIGASKIITTSLTFTGGNITAAIGLGVFAANDQILVEGVNLNNGFFRVVSATATTIVTNPPTKAEGPLTGTVRTA